METIMPSTIEYETKLRALRADYAKRRDAIYKDSRHTEEPVE